MSKTSGFSRIKWILVLAALVIIGGGAWYFFTKRGADAPQFNTVTVARGNIVQAVTATGTLNPVLNVQVGSQISGIIQSLFVDFNSKVTSNQVIAQLDPATYQANVMSAEADLANAKAQLELAQLNSRRAEELFKNKLVAKSEYDQTVAALHQAEAQVQTRGAALNRAQVDLSRCTIYAPVDGIVIDRKVDVGQTVAASMSAPVLFQIANDLTKMQIHASVSEADVGNIEEGQTVKFTVDAFPGRTFTGEVIQIRNSATTVQNVVTYIAVIEVSNADLKLKPGMTANVSVVTAQKTGVLKLANSAFRYKPTDAFTNRVLAAASALSPTNATPAGVEPPLTGSEPPAELQKRVSAMRERGEEVPQEIRAKLREYYQSGVLPRPAGGRGRGEGGGSRGPQASQPGTRSVHVLVGEGGNARLKPVTVKTGISDGVATEIIEGLSEGDKIVTSASLPNAAAAPVNNPFGPAQMPRR